MFVHISVNFILYIIIEFAACDENVTHYLTKKSITVKNSLKQPNKVFGHGVTMEFYNTQPINLEKNYKNVQIFSLHNVTHIVTDADVYLLNENYEAQLLQTFAGTIEIPVFIKAVEYQNLGIVAFAFTNGSLIMYAKQENEINLSYLQSIAAKFCSDVLFFSQKNELYMVLANSRSLEAGSSACEGICIFQWNGAHFDKIDGALLPKTVALSSFSSDEGQIIVALQEKAPSLVYVFKNEKLRKIQTLGTVNPSQVISYELEKVIFLVILDGSFYKTYLWNGAEFFYIKSSRCSDIEKIYMYNIYDEPVIFGTKRNKLILYRPTITGETSQNITVDLQRNYTKSIAVLPILQRDDYALLVLETHPHVSAVILPFSLYFNTYREGEQVDGNMDETLRCMKNLGSILEKYERETAKTKKKIETYSKMELENVTGAANAAQFIVGAPFSDKTEEQLKDLNNYLQELKKYGFVLHKRVEELNNKPIFANATIKGRLVAEKLKATSLQNLEVLNNETWNPARWLSYNGHQVVNGPAFAKTVFVTNLKTSPNDALFRNLLLRNGNQILSGRNEFTTLKASKITCDTINGIPFEDIYLKSQNRTIKGVKTFDSLAAKNVTANTLNKKVTYEVLNVLSNPAFYHFKFGPRLNIENLIVKEINGVNWEEFSKSVFRRGKSTKISGKLELRSVEVERLTAKSINNVKVDEFFTTTTNQTIGSIVHFQSVDIVKNLNSHNINGVDIPRDTVTLNSTNITIVQSPVSVRNLEVYGKLYLNSSKFGFTPNTVTAKNTLQIYHGKVEIRGNVVVDSISFDSLAKVIINGQRFQTSELRNYWLKNDFQVIPVHPTFQNGASIRYLVTGSLNGINISDYVIQNINNVKPANFYFENVTVLGSVLLDHRKQHKPDLKAIDAGSVKYSGRYVIKGNKKFEGSVTVKNLQLSLLDNIHVNKAVTKDSSVKITGMKNFESVLVAEDIEANSSVVNNINNVHLKLFQADALYVDEETYLPHVIFNDLIVQTLRVTILNGKPMNDFVIKRNRKQSNSTIASLKLQGNVTINKAQFGFINGVPVDELLARMLGDTVVVAHDVRFAGTVNIKNLTTLKINGVNLKRFSKRLLYRNYEQTVAAPFTFDEITLDNLHTDKINNISLIEPEANFSATNNKNVTLNNVKYIKTLNANAVLCDIRRAVESLENPDKAKWKSVKITGGLTIKNQNSKILNILRNVVTSNTDNVITAPVVFENPIFANTVKTAGTINGVSISHIENDAIYSTVKGKQITVTGVNIFQSLKVAEAVVSGNAAIPIVNGISVLKINSSIVQPNAKQEYRIRGNKIFFGGIETNHLHCERISGVKPKDLVNLKVLKTIPSVTFDRLVVSGDMDVKRVNGLDFDWFLQNRVLCKNDALQTLQGTYHFDGIVLNNAMTTPAINHVKIEDIVVDGSLQNIEGEKTFLTDVSINGAISIEDINGLDLSKFYSDSVFTDRDDDINGSVTINSKSTLLANLNAATLNGVLIQHLKYLLNFHDPEIVVTSAGSTLEKIDTIVEKSLVNLDFLPDKFMYVEELTSLRAAMPPLQDSRVIQLSENSSLVLLDGQLSGTSCGLPADCPCPIEHSAYFSPGKIVIRNNTNNRVFSYNEEDMFISLTTRTISVSSYCRTNTSMMLNEYSLLSWSNNRNNVKGSIKIPGYLSDAEFFSYDGRVYVLYCEYYNPVFDTHELFCTVLRSTVNSDMEQIQQIPVKGAWKTHILYTAQGVVLIIGNVVPGFSNYTDIYRFNTIKQKFEYLRGVKTIGCTTAAGVVLERNSLLILAQPETPMHILKYDKRFDNYYYFQSFSLDHPVTSVSTFYTNGFGISDAYLCAVMANGDFNIYSFTEIEGWKLESTGSFQGLTDLIPIEIDKKSYLFAPSSSHTKLLIIVKHSYV